MNSRAIVLKFENMSSIQTFPSTITHKNKAIQLQKYGFSILYFSEI